MRVSGSRESLDIEEREADAGGVGTRNIHKILGGMRVPSFEGDSSRLDRINRKELNLCAVSV